MRRVTWKLPVIALGGCHKLQLFPETCTGEQVRQGAPEDRDSIAVPDEVVELSACDRGGGGGRN